MNWEPRVDLKQGLEKTIVYFDQLLKEEARPVIDISEIAQDRPAKLATLR